MTEKAKMMLNMAESIAKLNNVTVERIDLNLVHMGFEGKFDHYVLTAWYSDGKQITIRQDCTITEKE